MKIYKNGTETTGTEISVDDESVFKYTGKGPKELFTVPAGATKYFLDTNGGEKTQINVISEANDEIEVDIIKAIKEDNGEKKLFSASVSNIDTSGYTFKGTDIYIAPEYLIFGFAIHNNSQNDILIKPLTTSIGICNR